VRQYHSTPPRVHRPSGSGACVVIDDGRDFYSRNCSLGVSRVLSRPVTHARSLSCSSLRVREMQVEENRNSNSSVLHGSRDVTSALCQQSRTGMVRSSSDVQLSVVLTSVTTFARVYSKCVLFSPSKGDVITWLFVCDLCRNIVMKCKMVACRDKYCAHEPIF
jgi:hypothetical protein